jgi:hypothetical protein
MLYWREMGSSAGVVSISRQTNAERASGSREERAERRRRRDVTRKQFYKNI